MAAMVAAGRAYAGAMRARPVRTTPRPAGRERWLVGLALAAFGVPALGTVVANLAFGFDEAVYAQLTRHWLTGAPAGGWDLHRPPGLSVLALLPQSLVPASEAAHRLIGIGAGIGVILAAWWLGRSVAGPGAAVVAAFVVATAWPLQVESASFLTDVPSSFLLLLMTGTAWLVIRGDPEAAPRRMAWFVVLAAAAFYLRYGAAVEIAGLVIAAAVTAPSRLVADRRALLGSIALGLLLLSPHVVMGIGLTGSPWGILATAGRAAGGGPDGLPLLSYAAWFPFRLIGPIGAVVAAMGVVAAIRAFGSRSPAWGDRRVFAAFIGVAVVVPVLVLGAAVHAEPRYLLAPMLLLVVLGSGELAPFLGRMSARAGRLALPSLAGAAVATVAIGVALTAFDTAGRASDFDWKRDAGTEIRAAAGGGSRPDCSVLAADVSIIGWYSRCAAANLRVGDPAARLGELTGRDRFVVVRIDDLDRPGIGELLVALGGADPWRTYVDGAGQPAALVYRLPVR